MSDLSHFHPMGQQPSSATVAVQEARRASLPFSDERDFEEARLSAGRDLDSIHPSLQRQAVLNMEYGLYEVVPDRIYQVRGFDLANISFVRSDTGWIVFDPSDDAGDRGSGAGPGHRAPGRAARRRSGVLALPR